MKKQTTETQALNIPDINRNFTIEDMKKAFIYGRKVNLVTKIS